MKITYIFHKFAHHAEHSGYDIIVKHLENYPFTTNRVVKRLERIDIDRFRDLPYFFTHSSRPFYFPREISLGMRLEGIEENELLTRNDDEVVRYIRDLISREGHSKRCYTGKDDKHIVHFLYGHLSFRYFTKFRLPHNIRIVLTIHEPPELIMRWNFKHLFTQADAIIAVSEAQKAYLHQLYGRNMVFVVPHGIDTKFFHQPAIKPTNSVFTTISVGHYMRDVQALVKVIQLLRQRHIACRHRIVTFERYFSAYGDSENVELFTEISDEELRTLYQTSDCLLLPLENATANNTVLEAMACGLPIVTTVCGGIGEYVSRKCSFLEKGGDVGSLTQRVVQLMSNPRMKQRMGQKSRKRAESFSWERIAQDMRAVYDRI